jgi:hypothetical protein
VIEQLLGIYMSDWTLEFDGTGYVYADAAGGIKRLEGPLAEELLAKEPSLKALFRPGATTTARLCALLKRKSLDALAN